MRLVGYEVVRLGAGAGLEPASPARKNTTHRCNAMLYYPAKKM